MFGRKKKGVPPVAHVPMPRTCRKGEMETLLTFAEKCAGRRLAQWEADVMETLVKAANENEAMHR